MSCPAFTGVYGGELNHRTGGNMCISVSPCVIRWICVCPGLKAVSTEINIMVRRTSIQRTFAETERGYQGPPPLNASFIHGIYYVYTSLSCCTSEILFGADTQNDTHNNTAVTHTDTQKNTQNSTQWHTKTCVFPCAIVCDGLIQPAASCAAFLALSALR